MNSIQLLVLNRVLRLPARTPVPRRAQLPPHLMPWKPADLGPVRPVLADPKESLGGQQWPKATTGVWISVVVLAFACGIGLFCSGLARVHRLRQNYQVSLQLRQNERELHQVQRAYHSLEAYVAAQAARDFQQLQLTKVVNPPATLKRTTRS
jgi:hypothetical protein